MGGTAGVVTSVWSGCSFRSCSVNRIDSIDVRFFSTFVGLTHVSWSALGRMSDNYCMSETGELAIRSRAISSPFCSIQLSRAPRGEPFFMLLGSIYRIYANSFAFGYCRNIGAVPIQTLFTFATRASDPFATPPFSTGS